MGLLFRISATAILLMLLTASAAKASEDHVFPRWFEMVIFVVFFGSSAVIVGCVFTIIWTVGQQ